MPRPRPPHVRSAPAPASALVGVVGVVGVVLLGGLGCASKAASAGNGSGGMTAVDPPRLSSELPAPAGGGVARPTGAAGNLRVLDWAGFKAAVTYTFDDTNSSQIAHYQDLKALGVRMTFYLITSKPEINDPVWVQALHDGHELANHTQSHLQVATAADVAAGQRLLESKFGVKVWTMAAPFGNLGYEPIATRRYLINRGVRDGVVAPNDASDPFNLSCYVPPQGAAASAFDAEVDSARAAGGWRIVLVHGFTGGTDAAYHPVSIDAFTASVNHAKSLGDVWIDSVVNIGSYWRGQKAFSAARPTTSGSETTWTWTLPANFPPGKFLRVTLDGGTLIQGGRPLTWDEHGYYEVALDPGSLTLAP